MREQSTVLRGSCSRAQFSPRLFIEQNPAKHQNLLQRAISLTNLPFERYCEQRSGCFFLNNSSALISRASIADANRSSTHCFAISVRSTALASVMTSRSGDQGNRTDGFFESSVVQTPVSRSMVLLALLSPFRVTSLLTLSASWIISNGRLSRSDA
jgi:hypothetical protein